MLRVLVLILVVPSLLMPPGMCVCQRAPTGGKASPNGQASVEGRTGTCSTGCRNSCRKQPASLAHKAEPEQPRDPSPPDQQHAPNCPALGPVAGSKYVETGGALLSLPTARASQPFVQLAERDHATPPDPHAPSHPPRYISFCALLI